MARTMQTAKKPTARNVSRNARRWDRTLAALLKVIIANSTRARQILADNRDLNVNDRVKGTTALIFAAGLGKNGVVKELLTREDIDVNVKHLQDGSTALMNACSTLRPATETVRLLLAHPLIDVNVVDQKFGFSALMYAVGKEHVQIVKFLLRHPLIEVNLVNKAGMTALQLAVERNYLSMVVALMGHPSIDLSSTNKDGNTALDIAMEYKFSEVEAVLRGNARSELSTESPRSQLQSTPSAPTSTPAVVATLPLNATSSTGSARSARTTQVAPTMDLTNSEISTESQDSSTHGPSSDSDSSSDSDTDSGSEESELDSELEVQTQPWSSPAIITISAPVNNPDATSSSWLATRLLNAGYSAQDVLNCEQRLIHEQRFVSEDNFAMLERLDDVTLLSIGIKELGLRAYLLNLHSVVRKERCNVTAPAAARNTTSSKRARLNGHNE